MMENLTLTIAIGWSLAGALFVVALWSARGDELPRAAWAALAGMAVLSAVTVYSHDVMALPKICVAVLLGSGMGLALGRSVPRSALPALVAGLIGQAGLGAAFLGIAGLRNPHAFGLLDAAGDHMLPEAAVEIALCVIFGALAAVGAVVLLRRGTSREGGFGPAMALIAALAGWAVAASAFLLDNIGMAVAGGLAGSAGTTFALRLCVGAGRKGLADAGARP
jgi:NAD(P) transhydrogenase subunit beta